MKSLFVMFLFAALTLTSCNGSKDKSSYSGQDLDKPKELMDRFSYTLGLDMGKRMREDSLRASVDYLALGMSHGLKGDTTKQLMSQAEIDSTQKEFQDLMAKKNEDKMKREQENLAQQGEKNRVEGTKFLENNKNKPGVKTSGTGLQYEVLKEGTGKQAKLGDEVKVQLVAMYMDGKEFDNTYKRQPVTLPINEGVVPAWREALQLMKEGGKMRIVVPPNLAWGDRGMPPTIPPSAVLIFEIELLSIEGKAKPPQDMPMQGGAPGARRGQ